jgi:hypothetical protein
MWLQEVHGAVTQKMASFAIYSYVRHEKSTLNVYKGAIFRLFVVKRF